MKSNLSNKLLTLISGILLWSIGAPLHAQTPVVIKLDDIKAMDGTCVTLPVMQYLIGRDIKASYGVIASKLDETSKALLWSVLRAKNKNGQALVEIWNHGLTHSKDATSFEFKNKTYAYQKKHFEVAHERVKKYLGVTMHTFGAPYNATDSICLQVVAAHPDYNKVFFSTVAAPRNNEITRLNNNGKLEKQTGVPDFETFYAQLQQHPEYLNDHIVLQGHPDRWTKDGFAEFKKILSYLDSLNCIYVLPSEL